MLYVCFDPQPTQCYAFVLLLSRSLLGFCSGVGELHLGEACVKTCSDEALSRLATNCFVFAMIGMGIGPAVSSALGYLASFSSEPSTVKTRVLNLAAFQVGVVLAEVISAIRLPDTSDLTIIQRDTKVSSVGKLDECEAIDCPALTARRKTVIAGMIVCALRAFVSSGLEAGTAMILQKHYQWKLSVIGYAIGACFLCIIPVKAAYAAADSLCSQRSWIRMLMLLSLAASAFFSHTVRSLVSPSFAESGVAILSVDAIVFPCFSVANGLVYAITLKSVLPQGSYFSLPNVLICSSILTDCIGRGAGPPLARWYLSMGGRNGGQDAYAMQQFGVTLAAMCLSECFLYTS